MPTHAPMAIDNAPATRSVATVRPLSRRVIRRSAVESLSPMVSAYGHNLALRPLLTNAAVVG